MKKVIVVVALALFGQVCWAQSFTPQSGVRVQRAWGESSPAQRAESVVVGGGVVSQEKYSFHWETRVLPPLPNSLANSFSTDTIYSGGAIQRTMYDRDNKTYFGYRVVVEPQTDGTSYRVTFQSLGLSSSLSGMGWATLPAPRFPPSEIVRSGEILELTLLTNSRTNQSIVDYISIQEPGLRWSSLQAPAERLFSYATGPSRDITANDVDLRIKAPRISINGTLEASTAKRTDDVSGAFVWFHLPKRGRVVLSLGPHSDLGFQKAGEVRGTSLEFKLGSDTYVLHSAVRIAPGPAAFNLYVLNQPDWKPEYPLDFSKFTIGAVDNFALIDK